MLIARSAPGEPAKKLTTALENVARVLDPEFQPTAIVTGVGLREFSMNDFLSQSAVAAVAGGVILLLAALGIYGVIGLMAATRTREIAVRAALGATRGRVLVMIIRDVVKLVLPGAIVGAVLTIVLNRLNAENMGISLSNAEPIAYVVGPAVAVLVAVLASLAPASCEFAARARQVAARRLLPWRPCLLVVTLGLLGVAFYRAYRPAPVDGVCSPASKRTAKWLVWLVVTNGR